MKPHLNRAGAFSYKEADPAARKIRRRQPDQTRAPPRAEAGPWIRFGLMTLRRQRPDARAPVNAKPDSTSPWTSLKGRGQSIPCPVIGALFTFSRLPTQGFLPSVTQTPQ